MFTKLIKISSLDDAKSFVNLTTKYDHMKMFLRVDNYEIDAHSIVGVLSIVDSENSAVFTADTSDNNKELLKDIEPFLSKVAV